MHSPRVYFNNIGSICTDSLRHGNGLSALLLLTRAAKSRAEKAAPLKHAPWKAGFTRRVNYFADISRTLAGLYILLSPSGVYSSSHNLSI